MTLSRAAAEHYATVAPMPDAPRTLVDALRAAAARLPDGEGPRVSELGREVAAVRRLAIGATDPAAALREWQRVASSLDAVDDRRGHLRGVALMRWFYEQPFGGEAWVAWERVRLVLGWMVGRGQR